MNEATIRFERMPHLLGTFTEPAVGHKGNIGFITFNAGALPRTGPHRFNVALCRAVAASGLPAVRFDLSGLGDSLPAPAIAPFENQAVMDLKAAMDQLESRYGVRRFAIMGICSGADHAYSVALADSRVVGITLFDPYMYPTWRTHWNRYAARVREHGALRAMGGWLGRRLRGGTAQSADVNLWNDLAIPSRAEFAQGLSTMLDRGVGIYLLYSGGRPDAYNYEAQFRDAFKRHGIATRVRCEYLPKVNHTVMELQAQRTLCQRLSEWARALPMALDP